jgi:hypothetical protein
MAELTSNTIRLETIIIGGCEYATALQLARSLGITVRTIARWDAAGIGPPKIKIGNTILFDVKKLQEWLQAHEKPAPANPTGR